MSNLESRKKRGINAFVIRVYGLCLIAVSLVFQVFPVQGDDWHNYLGWISFPVFAFLLSEGFVHTSDKLRYFARLLLFAIITEIPYNIYTAGKLLNTKAQNGMFTLCLGFMVVFLIDFIQKKFNNMVISGAVMYAAGLAGFKLASLINLEFASFGIMIVVLFYLRTKVSYPKLLLFGFLMLMIFYLASESYIVLSFGALQYTMPHRGLFLFAIIPIYMYNGERGPNKLWLQIADYCAYPAMLTIMAIVSHFVKI